MHKSILWCLSIHLILKTKQFSKLQNNLSDNWKFPKIPIFSSVHGCDSRNNGETVNVVLTHVNLLIVLINNSDAAATAGTRNGGVIDILTSARERDKGHIGSDQMLGLPMQMTLSV